MNKYPLNHIPAELKEEKTAFKTVYASPEIPLVMPSVCRQCGYQLDTEDNFCCKCGTQVERQIDETCFNEVYASPNIFE